MSDHEAIGKRAYELYLQRGCTPGFEIDDWLQAEAELAAAEGEDAAEGRRPTGERPAPAPTKRSSRRENAPASASSRRSARP